MRYLPDWLRRQRAQQLVNWGRVRTSDAAAYGETIASSHPDCPFYALRDVYVAGRPAVIARTLEPPFHIIEQSIDYPGRRGLIKRFLRNDLRTVLVRPLDQAMLLGPVPSPFDSFWHWMFEACLRAILAEECGFTGVYLVPPHAYVRQTLFLAGISAERLVVHDGGIWRVARLWTSSHLHGQELLAYPSLLLKLRAAMLRHIRPESGRHRVYVSRNRQGVVRQILNEPEFKALIAKFGFEEYFCEDHDIAQQLARFAACEAVIGSDGAGLATNALYMPEGSLVVSLFSPLRFEVGGTLLPVKVLKHRYYPIMPYVSKPYPYGNDVVANLDMIEVTLERELG